MPNSDALGLSEQRILNCIVNNDLSKDPTQEQIEKIYVDRYGPSGKPFDASPGLQKLMDARKIKRGGDKGEYVFFEIPRFGK